MSVILTELGLFTYENYLNAFEYRAQKTSKAVHPMPLKHW